MSRPYGRTPALLLVPLLTATLLLVWWWSGRETIGVDAQPQSESATLTVPEVQEPLAVDGAAEVPPEPGRIVELTRALAEATRARESVEAELDRIEREVAALESYLDDLEASGEALADHRDDASARVQPVLAAYLDAEARLQAAETREQAAADRLAAATAGDDAP